MRTTRCGSPRHRACPLRAGAESSSPTGRDILLERGWSVWLPPGVPEIERRFRYVVQSHSCPRGSRLHHRPAGQRGGLLVDRAFSFRGEHCIHRPRDVPHPIGDPRPTGGRARRLLTSTTIREGGSGYRRACPNIFRNTLRGVWRLQQASLMR